MITEKEISDAMDKAYIEAGHNTYFGNGFRAGVNFALESIKEKGDISEIIDYKLIKLEIEKKKLTDSISEILELLTDENGVPNIEWIKNKLLETK
jgi:hypothetical protein